MVIIPQNVGFSPSVPDLQPLRLKNPHGTSGQGLPWGFDRPLGRKIPNERFVPTFWGIIVPYVRHFGLCSRVAGPETPKKGRLSATIASKEANFALKVPRGGSRPKWPASSPQCPGSGPKCPDSGSKCPDFGSKG